MAHAVCNDNTLIFPSGQPASHLVRRFSAFPHIPRKRYFCPRESLEEAHSIDAARVVKLEASGCFALKADEHEHVSTSDAVRAWLTHIELVFCLGQPSLKD